MCSKDDTQGDLDGVEDAEHFVCPNALAASDDLVLEVAQGVKGIPDISLKLLFISRWQCGMYCGAILPAAAHPGEDRVGGGCRRSRSEGHGLWIEQGV